MHGGARWSPRLSRVKRPLTPQVLPCRVADIIKPMPKCRCDNRLRQSEDLLQGFCKWTVRFSASVKNSPTYISRTIAESEMRILALFRFRTNPMYLVSVDIRVRGRVWSTCPTGIVVMTWRKCGVRHAFGDRQPGGTFQRNRSRSARRSSTASKTTFQRSVATAMLTARQRPLRKCTAITSFAQRLLRSFSHFFTFQGSPGP